MTDFKIAGVIPARWGSTRFPGKSLAPIGGRPLVLRVVERARQARELCEVLVATDDERIRAAVERSGARVVMTRPDHPSGTDRIAEAIQGMKVDAAINIQGDEPMIEPELIDRLAGVLREGVWDMVTAASPIRADADRDNPSVVKVVWDREQRALYFSRSPIPFVRDAADAADAGVIHWRHIGVYGYRRDFLERLVAAPPCLLERLEKLEQLRALHLGARMKVVAVESFGIGVDTPEDVPKAEALLRRAGLA